MDVKKRKRTYWIVFLSVLFLLYMFADSGKNKNNTSSSSIKKVSNGKTSSNDVGVAMTEKEIYDNLDSLSKDKSSNQKNTTSKDGDNNLTDDDRKIDTVNKDEQDKQLDENINMSYEDNDSEDVF